jgi:hypothetical protein
MKVTQQQFENDLKPLLIQMGKHDNTWFGRGDHPYVTVNDKNKRINTYAVVEYNDYYIDHYNPELFLALAAMTDSEEGNVGEYWKFIDPHYGGDNFTRGKIYKQHKSTIDAYEALIDNKDNCNGLHHSEGGNKSCFTKATKEEIIAHFSKTVVETVNNKVCFKSDGTDNTGIKIINELIRLGGKNVGKYDGNSDGRYYYINDKGNVDLEYAIPKGYTLTELPFEVKLNVGDAVKVKPDARYRTAVENDWRSGPFKQTAREIQYIFKIEGDLICIDYKDYWDRDYFVVERKNVELVESKIKEIKMKNRILTPVNATRIINIACSKWKPKLAEKWATNIVLNKNTEISEEFYQEMRKACTTEQNELFDEIFGSDEQLINISDLEIGEAMKIYDNNSRWNGIIIMRIWAEVDEVRYVDINNPKSTWNNNPKFKGKKVKLTITHEEIN